jgi:hypothetical protein
MMDRGHSSRASRSAFSPRRSLPRCSRRGSHTESGTCGSALRARSPTLWTAFGRVLRS